MLRSDRRALFFKTNVNHFLLEYDTPRTGDFAPLRFVPKSKGVVLGLVSSKTPVLESLDALKRRTEEGTRYIDLDRLAISPQCDFASTVAGNAVTEADERAKLALVVLRPREFGADCSSDSNSSGELGPIFKTILEDAPASVPPEGCVIAAGDPTDR